MRGARIRQGRQGTGTGWAGTGNTCSQQQQPLPSPASFLMHFACIKGGAKPLLRLSALVNRLLTFCQFPGSPAWMMLILLQDFWGWLMAMLLAACPTCNVLARSWRLPRQHVDFWTCSAGSVSCCHSVATTTTNTNTTTTWPSNQLTTKLCTGWLNQQLSVLT